MLAARQEERAALPPPEDPSSSLLTGALWQALEDQEPAEVLSGAESTEEETEDATEAASQTQWFGQPKSKVVHFYRQLLGEYPIPLCHGADEDGSVESQPDQPQKRRRKDTRILPVFDTLPEHLGEGFLLLHAIGKRVCARCMKKVPKSTADLFIAPP